MIVPGDFIAISYNNHIDFGWYAGNGSGTLQYYPVRSPQMAHANYEEWLIETDKSEWMHKRYSKGFTMKCLWKVYINSVHDTRVMKITNVDDIFTQIEDRELYEKSREALIKLNFIKQQ